MSKDKKHDISKFFGILSKEEAEELEKAVKEHRKQFDIDTKRRQKFLKR